MVRPSFVFLHIACPASQFDVANLPQAERLKVEKKRLPYS